MLTPVSHIRIKPRIHSGFQIPLGFLGFLLRNLVTLSPLDTSPILLMFLPVLVLIVVLVFLIAWKNPDL